MTYNVLITPAAEQDCREVLTYLGKVVRDPQAAPAFVQDLGALQTQLETAPERYDRSREAELRTRNYHCAPLGHFWALYQIDKEHHTVYLARVFHGSQNYGKFL